MVCSNRRNSARSAAVILLLILCAPASLTKARAAGAVQSAVQQAVQAVAQNQEEENPAGESAAGKTQEKTAAEKPAAEKPAAEKPVEKPKSNSDRQAQTKPPENATHTQSAAEEPEKNTETQKTSGRSTETETRKERPVTVEIERVGGFASDEDIFSEERPAEGNSGGSAERKSSHRGTSEKQPGGERYSKDNELIEQAVERAMDRKLAPLEDMIRESRESGPGFFSILGFFGYIAGAAGLYFYMKNKPPKSKV